MKKLSIVLVLLVSVSFTTSAQWYQQNISNQGYFGGFKFTSEDIGWLTSNNPSNIYKTTDGGDSWNLMYQTDGPISSTFFLDDDKGWITDMDSYSCKLISTSNGGINWNQRFNGVYYSFSGLYFFNSLNGLAFGAFGAPQGGALFRTNDGGYNWQIIFGDLYYLSFYFIDSLTGWTGGYSPSGINSVEKTTDGGNTWIDFPSDSLNFISKIHFFNDSAGWVIAENALFSTINGGLSWNLIASSINDFSFVDQNNGWYVSDDKIFQTTNAGLNWNLQHTNNGQDLYTIFFRDVNDGWACGDSGLILRTINGGTPVELLSFSSSIIDNDVTLNWTTATETNNAGFQVERREAQDERSEEWQSISFINGKGTTTEPQTYSLIDENLATGKYQYRLKQIDFDGTFEYSNKIEVEINPPAKFSLEQNYPNPFNPSTSIQYAIASRQFVSLKVFNSLGEEVETLVNEYQEAGVHSTLYNVNSTLPSGVYYYQLTAGDFMQTRKMIIIK